MDKSNPRKRRDSEEAGVVQIVPMQLQIGDRLTDEAGVWEVIGRPYTSPNGKTVHAQVQRVGQVGSTVLFAWGAHERITVKRGR